MRTGDTRALLRRKPAAAAGILLPLLGVIAVLLGLLAMHSLNLDSAHAGMPATGQAHAEAHLTMPTTDATHSDECGGDCAPEHSMLTMACVLALLAGSIIVGAAVITRTRGITTLWLTVAEAVNPILASLAPPKPPSLLVLSISRR